MISRVLLLLPLLFCRCSGASHPLGFVHLQLKCGPTKIPEKPCSIGDYCDELLCADSAISTENSSFLPPKCVPGLYMQDVVEPCDDRPPCPQDQPCPRDQPIHTFKPVTVEKGPKDLFFRVYLYKNGGGLVSKDVSWGRFRLMPFPDLPSSAWRPLGPLATNMGGIWAYLEAKIICSQHHYGENCATECHPDWRSQCLENGTRVCFVGWEGSNCSHSNPCAGFPCEHGACWHEAGVAHCDCEFGWRGQNCDLKDPCATFDCRNRSCDVTADGEPVCTKDASVLDLESDLDSDNSKVSLIVGASISSVVFIALLLLCGVLFVRRRRRKIQFRKHSSSFAASWRNSSGVYEDPDDNHYSDSEPGSGDSYDRPGPEYSVESKDEDNYDVSHPPYTPARIFQNLDEQKFF